MGDRLQGPVLVTGATGDIGGQVVSELVAAGAEVRAAYRRDEQRDALADAGAEPVRVDLDDPGSVRDAAGDCEALFLLTPPLPGQADQDRRAVDAAAQGGVRRVVRVSAGDSNLRTAVPWAQAHAVADHHLAASGLDWTVLRPSAFFSNFLQQAATIRRGFLPQTSGRGEVSWIDTGDVAAVAARVLVEGGHDGATYFLTGPESLSVPDVAAVLSRVLGRRVRYVHLPGPVYQAVLRASGQSAFTARGLRAQFAHVVRGDLDVDTTYEVQRLLGRPPRTLEQWVTAHADRFR